MSDLKWKIPIKVGKLVCIAFTIRCLYEWIVNGVPLL